MVKDKKYYDFLDEAIKRNENGESWTSIATSYVQMFGEYITRSAMRHRAQDYLHSKAKKQNQFNGKATVTTTDGPNTYVQYNADGTVEESRFVDCEEDVIHDPCKLLQALGYDTSKWELITYRVSKWDGGAGGKELKAVQYKVRPRTDISLNDIVKAARAAFKEEITPFLFAQEHNVDGLNDDKLMEIAPIELHIGKMANKIETGENYDLKIAKKRFFDIFEEIYHKQEIEKCGHCVVIIGSDFFNSESDNCTSKDKVPQQNDTRYIKLFHEGIKMYVQALLTLRGLFNKVDVMLCAGNHARAMETFLYMALEQRFVDDKVVHFIENYRLTQVYQFGKCAIFYNHGDANLKQTIASIPAEFAEVWGTHPYRELHLGHLHKEVTVDENGGMITRRIGSPCGIDAWHYSNRFVGAIKKHQIFIWDKNSGLRDLHYITVKDN